MATALVVTGLVAAVGVAPAVAQSDEAGGDLRVVGTLERPDDSLFRPMGVDEAHSVGLVTRSGGNPNLHLLDLERLTVLGGVPQQTIHGFTPESRLAIDPVRERAYAALGYPDAVSFAFAPTCANAPVMRVFDYRADGGGRRTIRTDYIDPLPCTGSSQFYGLTSHYDRDNDLLYMGGVAAAEMWRTPFSDQTPFPSLLGGTLKEDRGQALLLRQMRSENLGLRDADPGKPRQRFVLDWEVDLRLAGCGRRQHVNFTQFEGFVSRLGDEVLVYCWDARPYRGLQAGQQGYLIRIPLVWDPTEKIMRPETRGAPVPDPLVPRSITNYVSRRVPTLPGQVTPILDQDSGRVMLVTTGPTNGNAVWVFDPKSERFVGVITGGYGDEPSGNTAVGFDSSRGRVYVLTQHGILIAAIRQDPLPAGLIYPVLVNKDRQPDFVSSNRIAVAPRLGRLYVAMNDRNGSAPDHYEVLEDHVPDPPSPIPVDPDALTTQVKEEPGKTASSTGGQAIASGARVVNTGGLPRLIGQNDPTCRFAPPNTQVKDAGAEQDPIPDWEFAPALFGGCLPDMAAAAGHREASAAASDMEAGTGSGATARSAAFAAGSSDTGTDGDIRRASDCGVGAPDQVDRWGRQWPFPDKAALGGSTQGGDFSTPVIGGENKKPYVEQYNNGRDQFWGGWESPREEGQEQFRGGCNDFQDGVSEGTSSAPTGSLDLRSGTRGGSSQGFPVPAAACGDFGGAPASAAWPEEAAGHPQVAYPSSSVACDASLPHAEGLSSAGVLAFPSAAEPLVSVGRVWSRVSTVRTPEGQVTVALASASNVVVGPLSIGEIRSIALAKAKGRTGTASAILVRQWCAVSIDGQSQEGCIDAASADVKTLLDEVNASLLQKVQLSVPVGAASNTPGGYQAVVTKDPRQRGADQAVNDDDGHTAAGLQAIVYNDGPKGRSRVVVQLAGVHAESRYGIVQLPNFTPPAPPPPGPPSPPAENPPAVTPPPPQAPPPAPDVFTPPQFVGGGGGETLITESVRFSPAPSVVRQPVPVGGNPVTRTIRVPIEALRDAINLLVQHPREFALLFLLFSLLSTPLYLGSRRRSFARALTPT